jgi:hypothetical protein
LSEIAKVTLNVEQCCGKLSESCFVSMHSLVVVAVVVVISGVAGIMLLSSLLLLSESEIMDLLPLLKAAKLSVSVVDMGSAVVLAMMMLR